MLGPDRHRFESQGASSPPTSAEPSAAFSPAQWEALRRFVAQVGGLENAKSALELLAILCAAESTRPGAR